MRLRDQLLEIGESIWFASMVQLVREIENGRGRARYCHSAAAADVAGVEGEAMDRDPRPGGAPSRPNGHADRCRSWVRQHPPEVGCASVAEDRLTAECEQGGGVEGVLRRHGMSDEIHAAVDFMEAAAPEAQLDLFSRDAQFEELPPRSHTVLTGSESGENAIGAFRERLVVDMTVNPTLILLAPFSGGKGGG